MWMYSSLRASDPNMRITISTRRNIDTRKIKNTQRDERSRYIHPILILIRRMRNAIKSTNPSFLEYRKNEYWL
jgi:hypothetical protein